MKCLKTCLLLGIFLIFCSGVWADIPKQINFQGILKDSVGNPYPDGNYSITFRIYDAASGGNILWQEGQLIAISEGLFTHILGSAIPIPDSVFNNSLRWLGIQVAGNPEITPRTQLISAPYSFQALRSDSAGVAILSLDLTCNGCVDANDLAANSVGTSEIVATQVQRRVTGTAPVGEYIRAINEDGSVVTGVDQAGAASGWTDDGVAVRLTTATDLVGIGTSAPLGLLHLKGNNYKFLLESSGNADVVIGRADTTRYGNFILANGDPSLSVNNRWAIGLRNGDSKLHLYSEINSSNVMVLEPGGNVGIGTTSPSTPLQVAGQISTNSGSATAPAFTFVGDLNMGIYHPSTDVIGLATNGVERMRITSGGDVGIGTTAPSSKLHVREDLDGNHVLTIDNQSTGTSSAQGIYFNSEDGTGTNGAAILVFDNSHPTAPATMRIGNNVSGGKIDFNTGLQTRLTISNVGQVGIGTTAPNFQLDVQAPSLTVAAFNRTGTDGNVIEIQQAGITEGTISVAATTVSYNAFTGSHYGWTEEALERGELVTLTGMNSNSHDNPKSEIIYGIKRSSVPNDPACLGSYLGLQGSDQPYSSNNPHLIMAVGNGDMWVVDEGEKIQPGDYLISSSTPGHAMKDDEEKYPIGHIVARAAETVDWSAVSETVNGRKHKKISVLFGNFVRGNTTNLTQTIREQQEQIEELKSRMLMLEASLLRSQVEN